MILLLLLSSFLIVFDFLGNFCDLNFKKRKLLALGLHKWGQAFANIQNDGDINLKKF